MNRLPIREVSVLVSLLMISFGTAQDHGHDHGPHGHGHGDERAIPFTVWTDTFEVFAEHPFVVVGTPAAFVTHVTELKTFAPKRKGGVTFVMTQGAQRLEHREDAPARDGIYIPELVFPKPGKWSVVLRVPHEGKTHDVSFPSVEVYTNQAEADHAPDPIALNGFSFLKEQQWVIPFMVETATSQEIDGVRCRIVPESALAYSGSTAYVYIQLGGETFERRRVVVKGRHERIAFISQGLNEQEHVTTLGVGSVALAHGEPAGQGGGDLVQITEEQMVQFEIVCQEALPGGVDAWIQAPGEIEINHEQMAHIVPRVKGVVKSVKADLGQVVQAGEVLAVLESRELADAKAEFLNSQERRILTRAQFQREERLFQQKVTSEQDYLASKQAYAKATIEYRTARQKLLALGLTKQEVEFLPEQTEETFTTYTMVAPFTGTIIHKHIVLGEVVDENSDTFIIADLNTLWVDLHVNQEDVSAIRLGSPGDIFIGSSAKGIPASVSYISQQLDLDTRTAVVRMVLDNREGRYRSGTFVTGRVALQSTEQGVVLPEQAVQIVNDRPCVFVKAQDGFAMRYVTLGNQSDNQVQILSGVERGDPVVIKNAFHLKSELTKQAISGHGHVH
jgi:cobalt-zinc-cadmium efflux system membrane fusion protein